MVCRPVICRYRERSDQVEVTKTKSATSETVWRRWRVSGTVLIVTYGVRVSVKKVEIHRPINLLQLYGSA